MPSARSNIRLAKAAVVAVISFPVLVLILTVIQHRSYNTMTEAVSELALGRAGWLMAVAFCCLASGSLLVALVIRRTVRGARVGPLLLAAASALTFVSAFVHADPSAATRTTTHGQIHILAGIATFVLIISAMFALVRVLRRDEHWHSFGRATLVWAVVAVLAFLSIPTMDAAYFGLAQRIFLGVLLSWCLAAAIYAQRALATLPGQPLPECTSRHMVDTNPVHRVSSDG